MAMKKIRRDDDVVVIAGRDKGKRGKVLQVLSDGRMLVSGIQIIKKHQKPNPQLGVSLRKKLRLMRLISPSSILKAVRQIESASRCQKTAKKLEYLNPPAQPWMPSRVM